MVAARERLPSLSGAATGLTCPGWASTAGFTAWAARARLTVGAGRGGQAE